MSPAYGSLLHYANLCQDLLHSVGNLRLPHSSSNSFSTLRFTSFRSIVAPALAHAAHPKRNQSTHLHKNNRCGFATLCSWLPISFRNQAGKKVSLRRRPQAIRQTMAAATV